MPISKRHVDISAGGPISSTPLSGSIERLVGSVVEPTEANLPWRSASPGGRFAAEPVTAVPCRANARRQPSPAFPAASFCQERRSSAQSGRRARANTFGDDQGSSAPACDCSRREIMPIRIITPDGEEGVASPTRSDANCIDGYAVNASRHVCRADAHPWRPISASGGSEDSSLP